MNRFMFVWVWTFVRVVSRSFSNYRPGLCGHWVDTAHWHHQGIENKEPNPKVLSEVARSWCKICFSIFQWIQWCHGHVLDLFVFNSSPLFMNPFALLFLVDTDA